MGEARVLVADGPTHHDIAALTDAMGTYRLDDLLSGVYTILVNVGDRPPLTRTVQVEAGRTAR
ncbi:MAG TPA: hypothetical protein VHF25_10730, partial [Nitriliruptorales bacterium]|nr:hypothetical protein [Nitriliruptorales bacterium]